MKQNKIKNLVIHDVENDDHRSEDAEHDRANRKTLERLPSTPKLNVLKISSDLNNNPNFDLIPDSKGN